MFICLVLRFNRTTILSSIEKRPIYSYLSKLKICALVSKSSKTTERISSITAEQDIKEIHLTTVTLLIFVILLLKSALRSAQQLWLQVTWSRVLQQFLPLCMIINYMTSSVHVLVTFFQSIAKMKRTPRNSFSGRWRLIPTSNKQLYLVRQLRPQMTRLRFSNF